VNEQTHLNAALLACLERQSESGASEVVQKFRQMGLNDVMFLLKVNRSPANNPSYYELLPDQNLCDSLRFKELVEYPTIFIVLKSDAHKYHIVPAPSKPSRIRKKHFEEDNCVGRSAVTTEQTEQEMTSMITHE